MILMKVCLHFIFDTNMPKFVPDGGYLLALLFEAVNTSEKRLVREDVSNVITSGGILFLISAGIVLIIRDLVNLL